MMFDTFYRLGVVTKAPDGKKINMVEVEFQSEERHGSHMTHVTHEWIDPKIFPEIPEVGQRVRFKITPTIVKTEVFKL